MERYLTESEIDDQAELLREDIDFRGLLKFILIDDEDVMIAETAEKILKRAVEKDILICYCKNAFCDHMKKDVPVPPAPKKNFTQYYDSYENEWVHRESDYEPTEMGGPGGFTGPVDI